MVGVRFLRRVGLRSGALFLSVLTPGLVAQASRPAGYRPPPHLAGEDEPLRRVEQGLRDAARARTASALRATVQGILAAGAAERSAVDLERLQLDAGRTFVWTRGFAPGSYRFTATLWHQGQSYGAEGEFRAGPAGTAVERAVEFSVRRER